MKFFVQYCSKFQLWTFALQSNALVEALSALTCLFGKVFFLLATSRLALMASIRFEHKNVRSIEQERNKMDEGLA